MPARRRPTAEFESTQPELGPQTEILDSLIGGGNDYTSPDLLSPQFWAASSNVYAGQFGAIRRARWAPVLNSSTLSYITRGNFFASMYSYLPVLKPPYVFLDYPVGSIGATFVPVFMLFTGGSWQAANVQFNYFNFSQGLFAGPIMRVTFPGFVLQANGLVRAKIAQAPQIAPNALAAEFWGLDTPDVSATITVNAGLTATIQTAPTGAVRANNVATITTTAAHGLTTGQYVGITGVTDTTFNTATGVAVLITVTGASTFTYANVGAPTTSGSGTVTLGITQTVGRSYQWAWENANIQNLSAPAPASQYVKYTSQTGTIDLVETGTVATTFGQFGIVGTGTSFTSAWSGRSMWIEGIGVAGMIGAVADSTHLTLSTNSNPSLSGKRYMVYDPQVTNIKLYATGDGGAVYFLIGRNAFTPTGLTPLTAGLEFTDTTNSAPPNAPFGSEITQIYNVPPPIGSFVDVYQGRPILYGVAAAPTTFFYGNIEATVVGQGPENFAPLNTVTMPTGDAQLNGSANLPTGFILWSNHQDMFKLTGLLSDNTVASAGQLGATIQRLPYKIGAASPYATAVTPLGAIWLSSDREVWLFTDHYAPKNIGKPKQTTLNRINGARLQFAKMTYYKRGDRSWLILAVALDSSTFNNKLLILDLDLLASNGQPSFFTFDMATNQPTWFEYDIPCEAVCTAYDTNSINHLFTGDVDLVTDTDWQAGFFTIATERNSVTGNCRLHAFGNENPQMVKTFEWMRALTNQQTQNLQSQNWIWQVFSYDDDKYIIGVNDDNGNTVTLRPGVDSNSNIFGLEYSPALYKFGATRTSKGRRFQINTQFPSGPGLYELRGFEIQYRNVVSR
jgi:hypothetical protein